MLILSSSWFEPEVSLSRSLMLMSGHCLEAVIDVGLTPYQPYWVSSSILEEASLYSRESVIRPFTIESCLAWNQKVSSEMKVLGSTPKNSAFACPQ